MPYIYLIKPLNTASGSCGRRTGFGWNVHRDSLSRRRRAGRHRGAASAAGHSVVGLQRAATGFAAFFSFG